VAVCGMLENETCLAIPEALSEVMGKTFLEFYDYYESTVRKKLHLHGQHMQVIGFFHRKPGDSHFGGLRCLSWQMVLVKVFAFKLQAFFYTSIPIQKGMYHVVQFPHTLGVAVRMNCRFLFRHTPCYLCSQFCRVLLLAYHTCNNSLIGICQLSCV